MQLVIVFSAALMLFVQAGEGDERGLAISIFNIALFLIFFAGLVVTIYFVLVEALSKEWLNALCASLIERIYLPCRWVGVANDSDATRCKNNPALGGKTTLIGEDADQARVTLDIATFHTGHQARVN